MAIKVVGLTTIKKNVSKIQKMLDEGHRVWIVHRSMGVFEAIPIVVPGDEIAKPDLKQEKSAKIIENENPPSDTTHAQNAEQKIPSSGYHWEKNAGDMDEKLAKLLASPDPHAPKSN